MTMTKISQMIRAGCAETVGEPKPAPLQDLFRSTQRRFLVDAVHLFGAHLKTRELDVAVKPPDDRSVVDASIDKGEGTPMRAALQLSFVPSSMTEIRLKVKDAAGRILDERIFSDAMRKTAQEVAAWIQRTYEMALPSR